MKPVSSPPRLAQWLLRMASRRACAEFMLGDLAEGFDLRAATNLTQARRWYWRQAWLCLLVGSPCNRPVPGSEIESSGPREAIVQTFFKDCAYSLRTMRKSLGFTGVMVLTLALGIGASTATFSVVHGVLLKPLPYPEPDRLMLIRADVEGYKSVAALSGPEIKDLQEQATLFESVGAVWGTSGSLEADGELHHIPFAWATWNLLPQFGATPILGRHFTAEDEAQGAAPVVLLSEGLWRDRYGADPAILGKAVQLEEVARTVVGIVPEVRIPRGAFSISLEKFDAWTPQNFWTDRGLRWLQSVGRLKPGVTVQQAQSELDAIAVRLRELHKEYANDKVQFYAQPLLGDLVREVRPSILALLGAVSFVLLITCSNVAGLLLARAKAREKEMAVRAALGAGRGRLARQVATESLLLALLAGGSGLILANWGLELLRFLKPGDLPRVDEISLDANVLAAALGASLFTALLFGSVPVWQATRLRIVETLKGAGGGTAGARMRSALVATEIGLSVVLLIGAGLMLRTLYALQQVDPGFVAENVLVVRAPLSWRAFPNPQDRWRFYGDLARRLESLPGVEAAGATTALPLGSGKFSATFAYSEETLARWGGQTADYASVTPGYLESLQTPLLAGRLFAAQDFADARNLVVVDETLARRAWPEGNAVGQRLHIVTNAQNQTPTPVEVLGVVRHVRTETLQADGSPQIYLPFGRFGNTANPYVLIRTMSDPAALAPAALETIKQAGSGRPVTQVRSLEEFVRDATAETRFVMALISAFAALAVVLASVGLYGVMAFVVNQQTREIGVRMALGAQRRDILEMVLRRGLLVTAGGVLAGLVASAALTRYLASLLFGVQATDAATYAGIAVLLLGLGLAASYLPAWRGSRVDPLVALRHE